MTIVHDVRNEKPTDPDEVHEIYFGKCRERIVCVPSSNLFKIEDEGYGDEVVIEITDADTLIKALNKMKAIMEEHNAI